jgi:phenylpropionate dioxygenase-like ring-hydroxylating dioxygenase large terminal subunit
VFRNACRHRGVALVDGAGCAQSLVCPYHGWTYRLDGSLSNVPHADGFPGLDAGERGLVEVPSDEIDGLIVIDPTATGAVRQHDAPWTGRAWRGALPPSLHLAGVSTTVQPMSWKVLVEQFLEGYHIRTTHRTTFYPLQYDNLNVVETFGANSRVTYPYRNIERLRDRPESTWDLGHRVTYVYHLFPNVIIATFPDMAIVATIDPIDLDHSTFTVFTLTAAEPSSPADEGGASDRLTGRALVDAGGVEDNAMSLAVQRGMHAGANEFVEFGRYESAIGHFHRNLTEHLALHRG